MPSSVPSAFAEVLGEEDRSSDGTGVGGCRGRPAPGRPSRIRAVAESRPGISLRTAWTTAWLLVASLHLLATPGTLLEMDQGEYLLSAERLLHRGTFTLAEVGEKTPWAGYARLDSTQSARLRRPLGRPPQVADPEERQGRGSFGPDRLIHRGSRRRRYSASSRHRNRGRRGRT
jgi:hypothetical protein